MTKSFKLSLSAVVGMALTLAACQPEEKLQSNEGEAQVSVRGLSSYYIDRMVITAQPANVTQELVYSSDAGTFSGRLLLPAGEQTLTAEGYSYSYVPDAGTSDGGFVDGGTSDGGFVSMDAGTTTDGGGTSGGTLVATGSATVTITAGASTAVALRVYDITPPPAQGDIAPLIRSMTASNRETTVGTSIQLAVDAVDLDGDALAYAWTSSCTSSTFSSPFTATTSWASNTSGICTLSVTVSSRSQRVTESLEVTIFSAPVDGGAGEGSAKVNAEYIARPHIHGLHISGPNMSGSVYRGDTRNVLPNAQVGTSYAVEMQLDYGTHLGSFVNFMESDCGGIWMQNWNTCSSGGYCYSSYSWTTPSTGAACKLTAWATNSPLVDSFSVGIVVR